MTEALILVVSGWRHWLGESFILTNLRRYTMERGADGIHIRVGDCQSGVDRIVREYLHSRVYSFTVYDADWSTGRTGGPIRNRSMLLGKHGGDRFPEVLAHKLLAFPQPGLSLASRGSGTADCVRQAFTLGVGLDVPGTR